MIKNQNKESGSRVLLFFFTYTRWLGFPISREWNWIKSRVCWFYEWSNLGFEKEEQAQKQPENGSAHTTKEVKSWREIYILKPQSREKKRRKRRRRKNKKNQQQQKKNQFSIQIKVQLRRSLKCWRRREKKYRRKKKVVKVLFDIMASLIKFMLFFVTLIVFIGIEQISCARQKSPLLVEDDGNRRNRPAGELKFILQIHKTKKEQWKKGGMIPHASMNWNVCPRNIRGLFDAYLTIIRKIHKYCALGKFQMKVRMFFEILWKINHFSRTGESVRSSQKIKETMKYLFDDQSDDPRQQSTHRQDSHTLLRRVELPVFFFLFLVDQKSAAVLICWANMTRNIQRAKEITTQDFFLRCVDQHKKFASPSTKKNFFVRTKRSFRELKPRRRCWLRLLARIFFTVDWRCQSLFDFIFLLLLCLVSKWWDGGKAREEKRQILSLLHSALDGRRWWRKTSSEKSRRGVDKFCQLFVYSALCFLSLSLARRRSSRPKCEKYVKMGIFASGRRHSLSQLTNKLVYRHYAEHWK